MPVRWSTLRVTEAMDMVAEFVTEADLPLSQAKIVATEARNIANLPQYLDQRLYRLIDQIERIDNVKAAIKAVLNAIPDGAIETETKAVVYGSQPSLV